MPLRGRLVGIEQNTLGSVYEPNRTEPSPGLGEVAGAAFRQENDLFAMYSLATAQQFPEDPSFDVADFATRMYPRLVQDPNYLGLARARSLPEFFSIRRKIDRELEDRQTLARSGWTGFGAAVAAGLLSPTTFIPLVGVGAKGLKAVRQGALYTGAAVGAQEAILHSAQETRTIAESAVAIGSGLALGGVLGGAIGRLRTNRARLEELTREFDQNIKHPEGGEQGVDITPPSSTEANAVGAAKSWEAVRGTEGFFGAEDGAFGKFGVGKWSLESLGPVTRQLNSPFAGARWVMAQFSDAGLRTFGLQSSEVAAQGGTLWARRAKWNFNLVQGLTGLDDIYARYVFGGTDAGPQLLRGTRAFVAGAQRSDRMSQGEFNRAVSRYMRAGDEWRGLEDQTATKAVREAGDMLRDKVYVPMFEEMKRLGMFPEDVKTVGDAEYLNRMYDLQYIEANQNAFLDILERHFLAKRRVTFEKELEKLKAAEEETAQLAEDLELSPEELERTQAQLEQELQLMQDPAHPVKFVMDEANDLDELAKLVDEQGTAATAENLRAQGAELREIMQQEIGDHTTRVTAIQKRLKNLNKSVAAIEAKRKQKLAKVQEVEDQQLKSIERTERAFSVLLRKLGRLDEATLRSELTGLQGRFQGLIEELEKSEAKLKKLLDADDGDMAKLFRADASITVKYDKLNRASQRIEQSMRTLNDRDELEVSLRSAHEEVRVKVRDLNSRRAGQLLRLREEIQRLDPEAVRLALKDKQEALEGRKLKFLERWRTKGFDDVDLEAGTFTDVGAREIADSVMDRIRGNPAGRLVHYDLLAQGERGVELERVLDISSAEIEPFLENNVEKLVRAYVRTVAPDMELFKRFGSVNAKHHIEALNEERRLMRDAAEDELRKKAIVEDLQQQIKATADEGEKARLKETLRSVEAGMSVRDIDRAYGAAIRDIEAVIGRMRHTWGVPDNPNGWAARAAKIAMNVNVLRFMGMVAVSSIPDVARTVMKYGPVRTYQSGLKPLVSNFRTLKLSAREARMAGTALDVFLHTRMYEMMDVMDDFSARTPVERGLEFVTGKMGIISGFDYWNTWMKGFGAVLTNAEILDSIQTLMTQGHKGARTIAKAQDFLAQLNIDGATAADIWKLVSEGGGGQRNGVWLPNTEDWAETGERLGLGKVRTQEVLDTFRAALVREVDSMIVTPGLERPLWMDATLAGRLLAQFRSFTFSSTTQTLMAGLQQRNANFALGTAMALGMGALSYKLWMFSVFGADTSKHPDASFEKWMDEAIDRSGMLGVFAEVRNIGSTIPWMNDYVMLSGEQTARRGGTGAVAGTLGPTYDLLVTGTGVLAGIDDPTVGTARQAKKLLPFQNVWWARKAVFDNLLAALDLPERRTAR